MLLSTNYDLANLKFIFCSQFTEKMKIHKYIVVLKYAGKTKTKFFYVDGN